MSDKDDRRVTDFLVTGGGLRRALDPGQDEDFVETEPLEQLTPGQPLGRYRVVGWLGAGGMGEVYEADDEELGRRVAIKVLPARLVRNADARQRFQAEARAVSALNHPNICTLYDIGSVDGCPFLVFELIQGESLRSLMADGPLDPERALAVAEQLARALHSAHERGILHRDIKPANIAITPEGDAKLLDFGIAKGLAGGDSLSTPARLAAETLTQAGQMPGTVAYMSPEQIRGHPLDARSDVFALGAVLYEMVAGHKAFAASSAGATLEAVLTGKPPSLEHLGHGPVVHRLVFKALAKNPDDRFASAEALADAIRDLLAAGPRAPSTRRKAARIAVSGVLAALILLGLGWLGRAWLDSRRPGVSLPGGQGARVDQGSSVAVLSFSTDRSGGSVDPEQDFLEVAVADEILQELLVAESLAVRPFSSSSGYTLTAASSDAIGRSVGAEVLVGGGVRRSPTDTVVTIEAIHAESGDLLWRETVRAPAGDLLEVERRVSGVVRSGLLRTFGIQVEQASSGPSDEDAYRLYLQARTGLRDREPNRRAIALLRQSVAKDPDHAAAWFELGQRLHVEAFYYVAAETADELELEARAAFERTLELQPGFIEAVADLINLQLEGGDLLDAYRRAVDLAERRPDLAAAKVPLAVVLRYAGLPRRSARLCDRAREIDAREPLLRQCSMSYLFAQRAEEAWESTTRSSSLTWQTDLRARLALIRADESTAAALWRELSNEDLGLFDRTPFVGCLEGVADGGELDAALQEVLAITDGEWKFYSAGLFAWCGRSDDALALLSAALDAGYCVDPSVDSDPLLGALPQSGRSEVLRERAVECRSVLTGLTSLEDVAEEP